MTLLYILNETRVQTREKFAVDLYVVNANEAINYDDRESMLKSVNTY